MRSFDTLGLPPEISSGLQSLGFSSPTEIQGLAVPCLVAGEDAFIQSETGTGKTFAYLAPAIARAAGSDPHGGPSLLVLCPTQELVVQVAKQATLLSDASGLRTEVLALLGGSPLSRQEAALKHKPRIVVGTPGRTADLIAMRALKLSALQFCVLDEADRLFAREYREAVETILGKLPGSCVRVLASATIGEKTRVLALPHFRNPRILDSADTDVLSGDIEHWVFYVDHRKRIDFLRRLETAIHPRKCLVFAASSDRVNRIVERMRDRGMLVDSAFSRQAKEERRVALERFSQGKIRYLVTTDLGARGLDIPGVTHVVSLDLPEEGSGYVHRAGRTGRAGNSGTSILLADGRELRRASKLAVERGFVFRTKRLEGGEVVEPPVEDFFAFVDEGEAEKKAYRASGKASGNQMRREP